MLLKIKFLFSLAFLSVIFLTGCDSESSKKKVEAALNIDAGSVINSLNVAGYTFSGSCVKSGVGNIEYSVESSGSSQGSPLTGTIDCTDGAWELPLSVLAAISDGELTLSLSSFDISASLTLTKDTQVPVLNTVTTDESAGSFRLRCGWWGCLS